MYFVQLSIVRLNKINCLVADSVIFETKKPPSTYVYVRIYLRYTDIAENSEPNKLIERSNKAQYESFHFSRWKPCNTDLISRKRPTQIFSPGEDRFS